MICTLKNAEVMKDQKEENHSRSKEPKQYMIPDGSGPEKRVLHRTLLGKLDKPNVNCRLIT